MYISKQPRHLQKQSDKLMALPSEGKEKFLQPTGHSKWYRGSHYYHSKPGLLLKTAHSKESRNCHSSFKQGKLRLKTYEIQLSVLKIKFIIIASVMIKNAAENDQVSK